MEGPEVATRGRGSRHHVVIGTITYLGIDYDFKILAFFCVRTRVIITLQHNNGTLERDRRASEIEEE